MTSLTCIKFNKVCNDKSWNIILIKFNFIPHISNIPIGHDKFKIKPMF